MAYFRFIESFGTCVTIIYFYIILVIFKQYIILVLKLFNKNL